MTKLTDSDLKIIRDEIISAISETDQTRPIGTCETCGESITPNHRYRVERVIDAYGNFECYEIKHIDCAKPASDFNPTMERQVTKEGKALERTMFEGSIMKDKGSY